MLGASKNHFARMYMPNFSYFYITRLIVNKLTEFRCAEGSMESRENHLPGEVYLCDEHGLELELVNEDPGDVGGGRARRNGHVDPLLLERAHDALGVPVQAGRLPLGAALAGEQKAQSSVKSPDEPSGIGVEERGVPVEGPQGVVEVEDDEAGEHLEQAQDLQRLRLHALVAHTGRPDPSSSPRCCCGGRGGDCSPAAGRDWSPGSTAFGWGR